jgi:hypothetical protein
MSPSSAHGNVDKKLRRGGTTQSTTRKRKLDDSTNSTKQFSQSKRKNREISNCFHYKNIYREWEGYRCTTFQWRIFKKKALEKENKQQNLQNNCREDTQQIKKKKKIGKRKTFSSFSWIVILCGTWRITTPKSSRYPHDCHQLTFLFSQFWRMKEKVESQGSI